MLIIIAVIYQAVLIISHFIIYDRIISENCYINSRAIFDNFIEAIPLVIIWTIPISAISEFVFNTYPIFGLTIMIYPYYKILKWLNSKYFFSR